MAVGWSVPNGATPLNADSMGQPDYFKAMQNAFQGMTDVYKPKKAAEALLEAQLKNKHESIINQYLPRSEEARIGNTEAQTGLYGQQAKYYGPNAESEIALREAQRGLYGAQSQKASQENELRKRLEEMYFPKSGNQSSGQSLSGIQEIPSYGRKLLGLPEEFPQERMQREIETNSIKGQNDIDMKRAQELRESAKDLQLAGVDINGIHDILTGPDSLNTGITKTLAGKLGWGSEKLGSFNERSLRLQAQMARALSQRGGVGAANIVAGGKPSSWKSTSENLGITGAYAERINNEFNLLNQEYRNITGKDLPYTLPEYVHNMSQKINSSIFKPRTSFTNEKEFHSYMAKLKPEQRKAVVKALREASK